MRCRSFDRANQTDSFRVKFARRRRCLVALARRRHHHRSRYRKICPIHQNAPTLNDIQLEFWIFRSHNAIASAHIVCGSKHRRIKIYDRDQLIWMRKNKTIIKTLYEFAFDHTYTSNTPTMPPLIRIEWRNVNISRAVFEWKNCKFSPWILIDPSSVSLKHSLIYLTAAFTWWWKIVWRSAIRTRRRLSCICYTTHLRNIPKNGAISISFLCTCIASWCTCGVLSRWSHWLCARKFLFSLVNGFVTNNWNRWSQSRSGVHMPFCWFGFEHVLSAKTDQCLKTEIHFYCAKTEKTDGLAWKKIKLEIQTILRASTQVCRRVQHKTAKTCLLMICFPPSIPTLVCS